MKKPILFLFFSIYIIGLSHERLFVKQRIETAANDTLPISTAHLDKSGVKHSDITIRLARFGAKIKPYFQNDNDTTITTKQVR